MVNQDDVFSALERIHRERFAKGGALGGVSNPGAFEETVIPPLMRRTIAVYEAAKALTGYITPKYDEITKVPTERLIYVLSMEGLCWSAAVTSHHAALLLEHNTFAEC